MTGQFFEKEIINGTDMKLFRITRCFFVNVTIGLYSAEKIGILHFAPKAADTLKGVPK
ncbi:MAG: hypothetical protein GY795_11175 [Desulfobacterales bacterium]|nr:hypothetical protein [Desulfobacterales bacterium]